MFIIYALNYMNIKVTRYITYLIKINKKYSPNNRFS